jgi:RNA polymerase sigma factor (sigma-70 family)
MVSLLLPPLRIEARWRKRTPHGVWHGVVSSDETHGRQPGRAGGRLTEGRPDQAAARRFEAVALPHADAAYNLALRLTRQPEAAEDVVHDAFLRALAGMADARAWLLTIVRHRAYDWLRERQRRATVSLTQAAGEDPDDEQLFDPPDLDQEGAEAALIRQGEAGRLHALIDALPPVLREALVLREMEDLSYRQIAEITGAPIGSVMSRLSRARAQLGQAWRRETEPEGAT